MEICQELVDGWSNVVKARILQVHDLHAVDSIYHQTCSVNFCTKNQMPMAQFATEDFKMPKLGCPQDDKRAEAFLLSSYLEDNDDNDDDEQITINDLIDLMNQKLANTDHDAYSYIYNHYED